MPSINIVSHLFVESRKGARAKSLHSEKQSLQNSSYLLKTRMTLHSFKDDRLLKTEKEGK
jgi:hypothetical protein